MPIFHVLPPGLYFLIKDFTIDLDKPWRNTRISQDLVDVPPFSSVEFQFLGAPFLIFFGVYP